MAQPDRIEAKLNALARATGGPDLKDEFERIEAWLPEQTFERARCGCWKGSTHREACSKAEPAHVPYHERRIVR